MDAHLLERYGSAEGAAAYRRKYERSWTRRWSNRRELAAVRAALARAGARGRLLDCPCGAGRLVPTLLEVADHVTAVDLSPAMVVEAREALRAQASGSRVDFAVAPADRLPFAAAAFDTVVCHRLLHHLATPEARAPVWKELARVAARRVVASFSDATTWKARLQGWRKVKRRRTVIAPAALAAEAAAHGLALDGPPLRLQGLFSLVAVAVFRKSDPPA
jgi:ubiquinone/menaquinone biosynthesis C-methylase UbiE